MGKDRLLDAAVKVSRYFVGRWPQTREDNPLPNYYFAGSLGTMLLASATQIQDEGRIITPESHPIFFTSLSQFPRPIGDIDLVITDKVYDSQGEYSAELGPWTNISVKKFPPVTWPILKPKYNLPYMVVDSVSTDLIYGITSGYKMASISVGDSGFFVNTVRDMLVYKVMTAIAGPEGDFNQFNRDFAVIEDATLEIETRDSLLQQVLNNIRSREERRAQVLRETNGVIIGVLMPKLVKRLMSNPGIGNNLRRFMEEVQDLDKRQDQILV